MINNTRHKNRQNADAAAQLIINAVPYSAGIAALDAPRSIEPSIIACGLNHVTTQLVAITFVIGISTSALKSALPFCFKSFAPIMITTIEPTKISASSSYTNELIIAPIPKKQATESTTSKNATIADIKNTRLLD